MVVSPGRSPVVVEAAAESVSDVRAGRVPELVSSPVVVSVAVGDEAVGDEAVGDEAVGDEAVGRASSVDAVMVGRSDCADTVEMRSTATEKRAAGGIRHEAEGRICDTISRDHKGGVVRRRA